MRDTLVLRGRIAMLACLSTTVVTAGACGKAAQPEQVSNEDRAAGASQRQELDAAMTDREKYYRDKARKEGKTFEEVAPERVLQAVERKKRAQLMPTDERRTATPERQAFYAARGADRNDPSAAAESTAAEDNDVSDAEPDAAQAPAAGHGHTAALDPADPMEPIDGDPPYVDGYNPEEESCPSGNWCAPHSTVMTVAVANVGDTALGCPERITGARARDAAPLTGKPYEDLSTKTTMQGTFNEHGTELARARGGDDTCCYHWFEYCSGRPHVSDDGPVVAALTAGKAWLPSTDAAPGAESLPLEFRERLAQHWVRDALMEHASIAAFSRATLELMAVGAPPELIAGCQRAALDEIEHARQCFALSVRYGAPPQQPGALAPLAPRPGGKAQLVRDTLAEGCVGETIAALVAERSARHCEDPVARTILTKIADDEARHAALAWATVNWAVANGDASVADALRQVVRALRPTAEQPRPDAEPEAVALARYGRLDAAAMDEAKRDAWRDIIEPMLARMLSNTLAERRKTAAYPTVPLQPGAVNKTFA